MEYEIKKEMFSYAAQRYKAYLKKVIAKADLKGANMNRREIIVCTLADMHGHSEDNMKWILDNCKWNIGIGKNLICKKTEQLIIEYVQLGEHL